MAVVVIPGRVDDANPESRDSGFDASHRPGMTNERECRCVPRMLRSALAVRC
jgi:hypothetical protein